MALKSSVGIILPKTKNPSKEEIILYDCPAAVELRLPDLCTPCVAEGDSVCRFQKVAACENGFSVYASIPGKVTVCGKDRIVITNDMSQKTCEPDPDKPQKAEDITYDSLLDYSRRYGITGAFSGEPLYKKIADAYGNCSRIIINCIESDPYSGHVRAFVSANAKDVVLGAKLLMLGMGVKKCIFALGSSYGSVAAALKEHISDIPGMVIAEIKEKYPIGNEYLLLNAIYKNELSRAGTTASAGYPVFSAETVYELFDSMRSGLPSVYKVLTLAGKGFAKPVAVRVPKGCSVSDLVDFIGTTEKFPVSLALGGPLNSRPVERDGFIACNTNMLLAYKAKRITEGTCIRCARCALFCPMDLVPFLFHDDHAAGDYTDSVEHGLYNCIECGICTYMCVGKVDILSEIRAQKSALNASEEKETPSADIAPDSEETDAEETDAEDSGVKAEEKGLDHDSSAEEIINMVAGDILSSFEDGNEDPAENADEAPGADAAAQAEESAPAENDPGDAEGPDAFKESEAEKNDDEQ